ncbi:MAG TPA: cytochrome c oxidase subunit 3 [Anaerolineales bacterium]|jgi:cytochrome c oxidase subunit 3/cytochrome o ubiquinol oxidase subunit 3
MSDSAETIPISQRENTKLAMWVFLGGEAVFFITLILLLVLTRLTHTDYDGGFRSHLSIPIIAGNTFVLVSSSYFVVRALEAIRGGSAKGLRNNLLGVIFLGLLFLAGQAYEWTGLFNDGVTYTTTYGTPFFTVTGIHGTHVFIGVIWAIFLLIGHRRKPFTESNHLGVENFGLYWHFVDIVWIVLFTVIYLI